MKLTLTVLLICLMGAAASTYSQTTRLDISLKNGNMVELIKQIESKSEFFFYYQNNELSELKGLNIKAKNATVMEILDKVTKGTAFDYTILDRYIVVRKIGDNFGNDILATAKENIAVQQHSISGKVTDSNNQPLPGVAVLVKGTIQGTVTDINGNYSLTNIPEDAVLVFSFVGMRTQEMVVGSQTIINVEMEEETIGLEEVVAIGYGTVKKSVLTGSISTVAGKNLQPLPSQRVDHMLQGQAAGVEVRNIEGAPGAEPTIRVRGMNSILGGNTALIVIDGLQRAKLSSINYNDIQSIEILKGPSATAIYGSEGANGVILITTKSGLVTKPEISFNSGISFGKLARKLDIMDAATYARVRNAQRLADNLDFEREPMFSEAEIQEFEKSGGTDWQDVIMGRTAITHNHNISINGGTDLLKYYVSGSFLDQQGIVLNSGYKRYTTRAKVDTDLTDWFSSGLSLSYAQENSASPFYGSQIDFPSNPIRGAVGFPPIIPVYNEDGTYAYPPLEIAGRTEWNPKANAVEPKNDITNKETSINAIFQFKILNGLSLTINGGARLTDYSNFRFLNNNTYVGSGANGTGNINNSSSNYLQNSNIITYNKEMGHHELTVTGVAEIKKQSSLSSAVNNSNFPVHITGIYDAGSAAVQKTSSGSSERFMTSYAGRINYSYKNKYLITGSIRADGSSVFGENNKWGYFPSGSIAYRISQESFLEGINAINNMMLRAAWGKTGNQAISPYQTLAKISTQGQYPWEGGSSANVIFGVTGVPNPDLKWETTEQTNFGVDVSLFKGKLDFTGDYYDKTTRDLLMNKGLPTYTGLSSTIANVGSIKNWGYEFSINYNLTKTNFEMTNGFNISSNKSKVLDLGDIDRLGYSAGGSGHAVNDPIMYLFKGEPWGQIYGWGFEGIWETAEEQEALRYGQLPGDPHYTDLNDDGQIDSQDRYFIGNTIPDFTFGFNSRIGYRNFELSLLIQGAYGHDIMDVSSVAALLTEKWTDRWTEQNQNTKWPGIIDAKSRFERTKGHPSKIAFPSAMGNANARWLQDGSYIRLKNLRLSYEFPYSLIKKLDLSSLLIYISSDHLITLTKYKGYNPEVSSYSDDKALGSNFFSYPLTRSVSVGINLTF